MRTIRTSNKICIEIILKKRLISFSILYADEDYDEDNIQPDAKKKKTCKSTFEQSVYTLKSSIF